MRSGIGASGGSEVHGRGPGARLRSPAYRPSARRSAAFAEPYPRPRLLPRAAEPQPLPSTAPGLRGAEPGPQLTPQLTPLRTQRVHLHRQLLASDPAGTAAPGPCRPRPRHPGNGPAATAPDVRHRAARRWPEAARAC